MTRYRLLALSALFVVVAGLALGSYVSGGRSYVSAAAAASAAPSATNTPTPPPPATAPPTPVLVNQGRPCLRLPETICGAAGQQTVNPQTDNAIMIAGSNWKPQPQVTIYLVKGTGACPLASATSDSPRISVTPDKSGYIQGTLSIPSDAKDGDIYRVCAQQGQIKPVPAVLLTIHISQPSQASTNLFDTYSAAALLLLLISVLAGVPELLRMTGSQAGR